MKAIEVDFNSELETDIFKSFHDIAKTACDEIEGFNPEIIIVLAHGGWSVLWALEALWQETKTTSLPPVLVLNIGREKLARYHQQRPEADWVITGHYVADYAGDIENGYFLAWFSRQSDWLTELREKIIEKTNGRAPARILVLDDSSFAGGTQHISLGLLHAALPNCSTKLLTAEAFEWKEELSAAWLDQIGIPQEEQHSHIPAVAGLITGTQDTQPDSLGFQPITPDNPHLANLAQYVPIETIMVLPSWTKKKVQNGVRKYMHTATSSSIRILNLTLDIDELILKYIWLEKQLTASELASLVGISTQKMTHRLTGLVKWGFLGKKTEDGRTNYMLHA